jgi:hypothetical protein
MTTQQANAIQTVLEGLAAERFTADQAARDAAELDAVSVLYAVQAKIEAGLIEEARAIVAAWRTSNQRSNPL